MADAEREARINLKTVADTTGAKETAKEIANVEQKTKDAAKASAAAEEPVKKLSTAKGKLRDAVKGLAFEFPQMARAISFITNPLTLVAAAAGVAAAKFLDWKRSMEEAGRKQAQLETLRTTMVSLSSIMKEMAGSKFTAAIDAIGDSAKTAAAELNKLNGKLDETRQRADALQDLERDLKKQEIRTLVARGEMSPAEAAAREAELDNQADESKAQREFRALQQKKKYQEDALRDIEPQIARLELTPEEDIARLKKRDADQKKRAADAEKDLMEQGPKTLDELHGAQATLSAFMQGKGVDVREWGKFGIAKPGMSRDEIAGNIQGFIEGKQREFDALVKTKDFEKGKSEDIGQRVTHAEQQNAQIENLRRAEDQLRGGIKDTDEEIKGTTDFNRRSLQLKRKTRSLGVDEFNAEEQKKREEKQRREDEKLLRGGGASGGGGRRGGVASVGGGGDAVTGIASEGMKASSELNEVLALNKEMFAQINTVIRTHKEGLESLNRRLLDQRVDV